MIDLRIDQLKADLRVEMNDIEPMTPEALSQYIGGYIGKEWAEYFEQLQAQLATVTAERDDLQMIGKEQSISIDQLHRDYVALLNDASIWRNRAISAETTLCGMDKIRAGE